MLIIEAGRRRALDVPDQCGDRRITHPHGHLIAGARPQWCHHEVRLKAIERFEGDPYDRLGDMTHAKWLVQLEGGDQVLGVVCETLVTVQPSRAVMPMVRPTAERGTAKTSRITS